MMRSSSSMLLPLLVAACLAEAMSSDNSCIGEECDASSMGTYAETELAVMEDRNFAEDVSVQMLQRRALGFETHDEDVDMDEEQDEIDMETSVDTRSDDKVTATEDKCDAFDNKYPDLVKVDFELAKNTMSNLGGVGPQNGPQELYYETAATTDADGDMYDLKVTVIGDSYQSQTPNINGQNGHYGVINVKCGTSVDLEFQFVNQGTSEAAASLKNFVFSWFDLDKGRLGGGEETVVVWPGYSETIVSTSSEVVQSDVSCPDGAGSGQCKSFTSSTAGTGKDNPTNPLALTAQQAARTFSVYYQDVSSFRVTLTAGKGFGSRNFLFTGMSEVSYASVEECCPDHVCGCQSFCSESDTPWEQKCGYAKCSACEKCLETTTTTTQAPASKKETCDDAVTFEFKSDNLAENTFGQKDGRLLFKNVVEHEGRSLDMTITDAANDLQYMGRNLDVFEEDRRGYTGEYKGAGRIAVDKPGKYMLKFKLTDSKTGADATLPLFPFTFYDVDGRGETLTACHVAGVITDEDTTLTERVDGPCYHHFAHKKEVNIPQDFESLTPNQKKQSATYVYRNKGEWDIGVSLSDSEEERYVLFKGSKVLACDYADKTSDEPWKNKGKVADALLESEWPTRRRP